MTHDALWAFVAGVVLGLAYMAAGYLASRKALASSDRFLWWVVGGTVIRLLVAVPAVVAVVAIFSMNEKIFLLTFLVIFFAGLITEVIVLHRLVK